MSVELKLDEIRKKILSGEFNKASKVIGSLRDREVTEYLNSKYPDKTSFEAFIAEKFGEGYNIKQHFESAPKSGSGVTLSNQATKEIYITNPDLNKPYDAIRCKDFRGNEVVLITYHDGNTLFCSIKSMQNIENYKINGRCPLSVLKRLNLEPIFT